MVFDDQLPDLKSWRASAFPAFYVSMNLLSLQLWDSLMSSWCCQRVVVHVTFRNRRFLSISCETWENRQLKIPVGDVEQIHDLSTKMMFSRRSSLRQSIFSWNFPVSPPAGGSKRYFFLRFLGRRSPKTGTRKIGGGKVNGGARCQKTSRWDRRFSVMISLAIHFLLYDIIFLNYRTWIPLYSDNLIIMMICCKRIHPPTITRCHLATLWRVPGTGELWIQTAPILATGYPLVSFSFSKLQSKLSPPTKTINITIYAPLIQLYPRRESLEWSSMINTAWDLNPKVVGKS